MDNIIDKIIAHEWIDFSTTTNIGEKSQCQSQKGNFIASRISYCNMYDEYVLKSYLQDQKNARKYNINLITYKYAYMMKYTDSEYFKKIENRLPNISEEKNVLVNLIMIIYMAFLEDVFNKNPSLNNGNRKIYSYEDTKTSTSVQTYMKGEFYSYSENTLKKILHCFFRNIKNDMNPVLKYMIKLNSYS